MLLILVIVFLAAFALIVLLAIGAGGGSSFGDTLQATLDAVLLNASRPTTDEVVDVRKNKTFSSIPLMDRLLARIRAATHLRRVLEQADLPWTPGRVCLLGVAAWLGAFYIVQLKAGSPWLSLLFASPAVAVPFLYVFKKRESRFNRFQEKLPDSIDLMVSALRAGNSTMGALGIVASEAPEPVRREFRTCFDEQSYGVDMRAAMENLVSRVPLADVRIITTAILIQKESGGNLAEVLDKTAHVIRDRFRLRAQVRVHSAQGRLTGWILSAMPLVM